MTLAPGRIVAIIAVLVVIFLQVPVIVTMLAAVSTTSYLTIPPQGLTLHWFAEVLSDPEYLKAIRLSLILAVSSTTLSLVLGVAAAWAIHSRALPGSEAIASFLMAPLVFPSVVIGVALLQYVSLLRLYGGTGVLIAAHVVITVPYIVRAALSSLGGVGHLVQFLDEHRALGHQILHHGLVVDDFMADIDRGAKPLDGPLDDLDRPVDAGAEAARLGQDQGDGGHLRGSARGGGVDHLGHRIDAPDQDGAGPWRPVAHDGRNMPVGRFRSGASRAQGCGMACRALKFNTMRPQRRPVGRIDGGLPQPCHGRYTYACLLTLYHNLCAPHHVRRLSAGVTALCGRDMGS